MRRNLILALAVAAVASLGVVAVASALTSSTFRAGNLIVTAGGGTTPSALSRTKYTPVKTTIFGKIKTSDGTHPSAMREVVFDIDKDVKLDVKGYPVCKPGQLTARNTAAAKRVCGKTVLGEGLAHAEIAFPEQKPIVVKSPITLFNGGGNAGKMKLLIHTFITVPVPAAIVTQTTIQKKGTGIHTISKIPVIAGGSGSVLDFNFKVGKTYNVGKKKHYYSAAKCPDGKFIARVPKALFKNEARVPGVAAQTVLKGSIAVPCKPKG
jgi:hypothetical protein